MDKWGFESELDEAKRVDSKWGGEEGVDSEWEEKELEMIVSEME